MKLAFFIEVQLVPPNAQAKLSTDLTLTVQAYSILYVSIAVHPDDRTARARIRDAALYCFARDGFSTPLRVIAERAEVSVPLITHHYGTKDTLRETCDDWVLERFLEMKLGAIAQPSTVKQTLADTSGASVLTVYIVRSFLDATSSASRFFERYVERLRQIIDSARQADMLNPSPDEEERLHLLATQSIGSMMVEFVLNPPANPSNFVDQVFTARNMAAYIDLYSHAFFKPSPAMDTYSQSIQERGQASTESPSD